MLVFFIILLSILLTTSIIGIVFLWKAGERKMTEIDILNENIDHYVEWITDWRIQVLKAYTHIKLLDDREIFSRDDEVGVVFQDMVELIKSLNDKTQEEIIEEKE